MCVCVCVFVCVCYRCVALTTAGAGSGAAAKQPSSANNVSVGPVRWCVIRLIKARPFPALPESFSVEFDARKGDVMAEGASGFLGAGSGFRSIDVAVAAAAAQRKSVAGATGAATASLSRSVTRTLTRAPSKIASKVFLSKVSRVELVARHRLLSDFLRELMRIKGLKRKVVWHQLAYLLLAFLDNFLYPVAYEYIIFFGLERARWDMSLWIACLMMLITLIKYRIKLNYFHGSMLVLQHLRAMLARKYLSLSPNDHLMYPELNQHYRVAILFTTEEIRNSVWKGIFHHGLPNLYKVLMSLLYIVAFQTDRAAFSLSMSFGLVVFVFSWYTYRAIAGAAIAKVEFQLSNAAELKLEKLTKSWALVQRCGLTLGTTKNVFDAFWTYIRSGLYVTWYHRFYTAWLVTFVRLGALFTIWAMAPSFAGNTASFVALNSSISSLGSSLQTVATNVLDVMVGTSKVDEVSRLLNYETDELRRARRERSMPRAMHARLSSALDTTIQRWMRTATDNKATNRLIRQTKELSTQVETQVGVGMGGESVAAASKGGVGKATGNGSVAKINGSGGGGSGGGGGSSSSAKVILDDLADLMATWASLLDENDGDDGGSMLIYDVHYTLPQLVVGSLEDGAPTVRPIFQGLCVKDMVHGSTHSIGRHETAAIKIQCIARGFICRRSKQVKAMINTSAAQRLKGWMRKAAGKAQTGSPIRLPAGVIIGMRTTSNNPGFESTAEARCAYTLAQMFAGQCVPQRGIARCFVKVALVDNEDSFEAGSLLDNLLLGTSCSVSGRLPAIEDVWALCSRVGISKGIIGETFGAVPGWEKRALSSATVPIDDQVCRLFSWPHVILPSCTLHHTPSYSHPLPSSPCPCPRLCPCHVCVCVCVCPCAGPAECRCASSLCARCCSVRTPSSSSALVSTGHSRTSVSYTVCCASTSTARS